MAKRLQHKYHLDGTVPLPGSDEILVFGSNERGRHGLGAALLALKLYGAIEGQAVGLQGNSYAVPTKDRFMRPLSLKEIAKYVKVFVEFTKEHPELSFFVTRVGCGLAHYKNWQIAPMFSDCSANCSFPDHWKPFLK